jgi:hypothetical protein
MKLDFTPAQETRRGTRQRTADMPVRDRGGRERGCGSTMLTTLSLSKWSAFPEGA